MQSMMNDAHPPDSGQAAASASGSEPGFDLGPAPARPTGYRVLARKYRPQNFADLIGQEAMVRTLTNAFATGRLPQAWILTGVRGVGKTTTARILARALNYELPDGTIKGPTIDMPAHGLHCQAIIESRHVDVLEMDAASHNGVYDVRQINEAVRYAPVTARHKVYILDEVHMLSGAAFNALLKTLEEPPPHVKFVFATTEIRKVPVTVLSRCQRFDLRRIEGADLVAHLKGICGREGIEADSEALALIARAAEGSVRDALSLTDQAIAHAGRGAASTIALRVEDIRQMLGLADRARVIDLFEALMRGDMAAALKEVRDQYDSGADPAVVLGDLAEFTHFVTRVKIVPSVADDVSLTEVERVRGRALAASLSMRVLARTWQMLLKGLPEVQTAARPIAAAEMVLVRIAYVSDLPTPDEVIRSLGEETASSPASRPGNGGVAATPAAAASPGPRMMASQGSARAAPAPMRDPVARLAEPGADTAAGPAISIARFEDLIALAAEKRDLVVRTALERDVRLVRFEDGRLEIAFEPGASKSLVGDLARKISSWTGRRWMVVVSAEPGAPTMRSRQEAQKAELKRGVSADPLVQAVLNRFPGAEIVRVTKPGEDAAPAAAGEADESPPLDDATAFGMHGRPDDADDDV
jgi:DNA polymerase-3 subunit gamma/tau